jgi:glycine/D-amino acid oxidase-like deaminating enzyme
LSKPSPVTSDLDLPPRTGVAVIGGGIIGVATALELAERGIDVALFEKGEIAAEQSSRNWGWCRQMGRDPREIPLILESLKAWRGMNKRVGAETGFRQCGIVYLCETEAELAAREKWHDEHARPYQLDTRLVSGEEAERLQPGARRQWKGALYTSADGRAEPTLAGPAIADAARARGAKIFTNCAARGLETLAGRVSAIVTERGRVAADTVVLAGGAWSRRFCHNMGVELPQLTVVNSVQRTEPIDTGLERSCSAGKFSFRKRNDGGYTIAHRHLSVADIVPDSFRLFFEFLASAFSMRQG